MAKLMGRNWKAKPGIRYANEGWPEPCGRAREKRDWQAQARAEAHTDLWDAYYSDAYRHMHDDSGYDHEASDRAACEWADRKVNALG